YLYLFFQAEDGIRYKLVNGVQTCALPIFLLSLGRMRTPGDDVLHFNQPTDVAFDRDGNIYIADGEGNSRVLKFNKYGNVLLGWRSEERRVGKDWRYRLWLMCLKDLGTSHL